MEQHYQILLYYCYAEIKDPEQFREQHHLFCLDLGLLGRIIVAGEGINGTVSGTREATEAYMQAMKADPRFAAIEFKVDTTNMRFKNCTFASSQKLYTLLWHTSNRMSVQAFTWSHKSSKP